MRKIIYTLFGLSLIGCASGNCRQIKESKNQGSGAEAAAASPIPGPKERVKVYKYDGSLQCSMGKSIKAEDMKKDLKNIKVYSSINKDDGLMHIQQCGTPTGKVNIFEIDRAELEAAKKLGFKEWTQN